MRKSSRRKKIEGSPPPAYKQPVKVEGDRNFKTHQTTIVTIDWDSFDTRQKIEEEIRNQLIDLYYTLQDDPGDAIEALEQIADEKPGTPIIRLYLETAYRNSGEIEKANDLCSKIFEKFPDSLSGIIAFISLNLETNQLEPISKLLENRFEYKTLFPNRKSFHIFEVVSFCFVMGKYFSLLGDHNKAENYLEQITKIDEDNKFHKHLEKFISKKQGKENIFKRTFKKLKKSKKDDPEESDS